MVQFGDDPLCLVIRSQGRESRGADVSASVSCLGQVIISVSLVFQNRCTLVRRYFHILLSVTQAQRVNRTIFWV